MGKPKQVRPAVQRALDAFEAVRQQMMNDHATDFAGLDVTMAQAKLLYVAAASEPLTMSEVAQRLGVSISTASGAVEHLVELGYLKRADDPANRRQVRVSATARGRETLDRLRELGPEQFGALLDVMTDTELAVIEQAARIMHRAAAALAAETAASTPTKPSPSPCRPSQRSPR